MDESKDGITRVKNIVQNLKDFSHVDASDEWHYADLHSGINSTLNIVNNEIKYKANVVKEYGAIPEVECLLSQLNQVFMNLLVNAAHAIEERGTITIRTGQKGDEVWVEVTDTGKGIAPEHLKKIFDPFFTTKPIGKGTGLGLSLSYGIVQKHHGRIEVQSEIGKGTIFRVWLPIKQPQVEQA
jgi:signal transduction histidine kinase